VAAVWSNPGLETISEGRKILTTKEEGDRTICPLVSSCEEEGMKSGAWNMGFTFGSSSVSRHHVLQHELGELVQGRALLFS
jgi:alcohol dehydrogenase class IV